MTPEEKALFDITTYGIKIEAGDFIAKSSFEVAAEALKKQIPEYMDGFKCPHCGHYFEEYEYKNYCPECGQRMKREG